MGKTLKFRVAQLVTNVPPARQLSQELCNFLLAGQPGAEPSEMVGLLPDPLALRDPFAEIDPDYEFHEVTSEDLLNLTHARPNFVDHFLPRHPAQRERAHSIYSIELARLLPVGHPYRRAHGIVDDQSQVLRWLVSDPDLLPSDRQLIEEALLQENPDKRAQKWPLLMEARKRDSWAWHDLRAQLFANIHNHGDQHLESLHPREALVLRSIASGSTLEAVAEKFGVETARIVVIYAEAGEKFRQRFSVEVALLQACIERLGIVTLEHLAGVARDPQADEKVPFIFTRLLLKFCSGHIRQGLNGTTYILSNSAFEDVVPL